jgi:hypothetical protein
MVTLNIDDFSGGIFALALNQNNLESFNQYISNENIEATLLRYLGKEFLEDYKANPSKYVGIETLFNFQIADNTVVCLGLRYVIKGDIYLSYTNEILGISATDIGRVKAKNEASTVDIISYPKTYNMVRKQAVLLHAYVKKTFQEIKINDLHLDFDSFI